MTTDDLPLAPSRTYSPLLSTSYRRSGGRLPSSDFDIDPVIAVLAEAYDLGEWRSWSETPSGKSNDSYFVETDAGEYVMRRSSRLKTPDAARFEHALIEYLVAEGYPAPPVVLTRRGDCLVEVDDRVHMVMTKLPGTMYDKVTGAQMPVAARGLGWYHRLVSALPPEHDGRRDSSLVGLSARGEQRLAEVWDIMAPLLDKPRRRAMQRDFGFLTHEMRVLDDSFAAVLPQLTYVIVHGSYGRTALLLGEDDQLTGVVDYDRAVHDLLVFDLTYGLKSFARPRFRPADGGWIDFDRAATFMTHYRSEFDLPTMDTLAIPLALRAHRLATVDKKCGNVLTKHALLPRQLKDAENFAELIAREADRIRWVNSAHLELSRALQA